MSKAVLVLLISSFVLAEGCARPDARRLLQHGTDAPEGFPKVLAVYMPWFGDPSHINVGYSTQDPKVLRDQVAAARGMGISAFVVDWYGERRPFLDKSFASLQEVASEQHFQVALMYDEEAGGSGDGADDAIEALDKAYRDYIGPDARYRDAYLLHEGRPVVFIFPKRADTDWNRVRQHVSQWASPPVLIHKDEPKAGYANAFDGFYAWVHPGHEGWTADGSDWGKQYLEEFYRNMQDKHPDKLLVGAAWPGFDDTRAQWSLNRRMDARCGKTLQDGLNLMLRYNQGPERLPFVLIETWNDYEEGTAIERRSYHNCASSG